MTRSSVMLCLLHILGNAALLFLVYYWLGLGESDTAHLVFSGVIILFFGLALMWLHGTSFVFFRRDQISTLAKAALRSLRHLLPLFALGLLTLAVYVALGFLSDSIQTEAFKVGSFGTMILRRPVPPTGVSKVIHWMFWAIYWILIPVCAFPLASDVATRGWSGFSTIAFRRTRDIWFDMRAAAVLIAAAHFPIHLYLWIPKVSSFSMELLSLALRIGLGYLVFTAGLLLIEFITSAGMPLTTQESTVVSP